MKNIKIIIIAAISAIMLAGCAENTVVEENSASAESSPTVSSEIEEATTSSTTSEIEETATSIEETTSSTTSEVEENTTSTTSEIEETTTSSTESKPEENSNENSSATVENPVHTHKFSKATCEKPATCECGATKGNALGHNFTNATCDTLATCTTCGATKGTFANHNYNDGICSICGKNDPDYKAPHNCDIDGHIWDITYTTTEPKWCREMHNVLDYGFDVTLAERNFPNISDPCRVLWDNLDTMGVPSATGSATIDVEVWGTETYEHRECKVCGDTESYTTPTITPMGEWRYINGKNPRCTDPRLNFNTLFYDPNNIPEVVIDNINLEWSLW